MMLLFSKSYDIWMMDTNATDFWVILIRNTKSRHTIMKVICNKTLKV